MEREKKNFISVIGILSLTVMLILVLTYSLTGPNFGPSKEGGNKRIVSMAPSITEILFKLGLGNEVVGVTDYCNYPHEVRKVDTIGGFKNPSIEKIISLGPDLVIATRDGNKKDTIDKLKELEMNVLVIRSSSFEEIFDGIVKIGKSSDKKKEGKELVKQMKNSIKRIEEKVKNSKKKRVAIVYSSDNLILAGKNSFGGEMIEIVGAENVAKGSFQRYPQFSIESLIKEDPEVIIDCSMGSELSPSKIEKARQEWARWNVISAIKNERIYFVDSDLVTRPGPRIIEGLKLIAKSVYPELFSDEKK